MATTKQSAATIDLIKEMYLAGASYRQIGTATKCGMSTLVNIVKAAGLPPRGKKAPKPFTMAQLETLAKGGFKAKVVNPDLSYLDHTPTEVAVKSADTPMSLVQIEALAAKVSGKPVPAPKRKPASKPAKRSKPAPKAKRSAKRTKRTIKHATLKVGTVIKKLDRDGKVRARCTVVKDGYRYAGKTYASISSAAMAAMKTLKLKSVAVNGYVWWGIAK